MDTNFEEFHLDQRLLKTLSELGWDKPTDIQAGVIPHILEKKNLIISARTGSGKTAAYLIPTIQELLISKQSDSFQFVSVLILCPSKELCAQSKNNLSLLTKNLDLSSVDISSQKKHEVLKPVLLQRPDFIIGTPSQVLSYINDGLIKTTELKFLVIDEADLMYGFGYKEDLEKLQTHLNLTKCQFLLLSATLGEDVKQVKSIFPVRWFRLQLNNGERLPSIDQLNQLVRRCEEDEKYHVLVSMLKLSLIKGKSIIFTNSVDKCYRLRLVFDAFHIRCVVLNAEMPVASRNHIVYEFNAGRYDLLLASDEDNLGDNSVHQARTAAKTRSTVKKDEEFKISRGIDFNQVSNVINFDCPSSISSYVHRVGRCARVNNKGQSLTFVSMKDNEKFEAIETAIKSENNGTNVIKELQCGRKIYEGFVYRINESMGKCTRTAIRQARLIDIYQEIENSQILKSYFQENANELQVLKHSKPVQEQDEKRSMKNVPTYIVPAILKDKMKVKSSKRKRRPRSKNTTKPTISQKKSANPLFSFKTKTKK